MAWLSARYAGVALLNRKKEARKFVVTYSIQEKDGLLNKKSKVAKIPLYYKNQTTTRPATNIT